MVWRWEKTDIFSIHSMYLFYKHGGMVCRSTETIFRIKAPLKVRLFVWLTKNNAILTWDNLQKRGWKGPGKCVMCNNNSASVIHLFFECVWARRAWDHIFDINSFNNINIHDFSQPILI